MDVSHQKLAVAQALRALEASIERLVDGLAHSAFCPTLEAADKDSLLRQVCTAYSRIDYGMEDRVDSSIVCLGVVGVSRDIFKAAARVNEAKLKFRSICTPLSRMQTRTPVSVESSTRALTVLRAVLRSLQRSDLNLLAAYRKIPLLNVHPASITYSRANTRSVYRKSVTELEMLLRTAEGPRASADRARLAALDPSVTHLAYVRGRHRENVRANIAYARLDARGRGRVQIAAELPILYVMGRRDAPVVRFPSTATQEETKRVRASKLEATALLETLPVYRYLAR